eukprot:1251971-Prorocentrum_lima.AAC.1
MSVLQKANELSKAPPPLGALQRGNLLPVVAAAGDRFRLTSVSHDDMEAMYKAYQTCQEYGASKNNT